jgi:hypothetical protein
VGGTIELSTLEYDILWEHLRLGPFPPILTIDSHGATLDERAKLATKAWDSLAAKDLGWPSQVDARLRRRLCLLARPEWELDARLLLSPDGPRTTALIAARNTDATVAVLHADKLTLRTAPADRITHDAVSLLPPHPPGTGASITVPASLLDTAATQAGSDPTALARALIAGGLGKSEARKIADIAGTVARTAQFGAARTSRFGNRQRAAHAVTVYDTPHGRYLLTRKPAGDRLWITLLPGTNTAITRQLDELFSELR